MMLNWIKSTMLACFCAAAFGGAAHAATVTVPISSGDVWGLSTGGTGNGSSIPIGGPAIWIASLTTMIPAGATNISFQLDTFSADDKGVVTLNGTIIADATVQTANGTASGAGTFHFGVVGGNDPYTFLGFTPGAAFSLPDGTTTATITVFMNDTSSADPNSTPLPVAFTTSFGLGGTLSYDTAVTASSTALQSSANPSIIGQAVTFTATVTGNAPTGTVQFFDGAVPLGGPITLLANGTALVITSNLSAGSHVITASYSGDANNASSTSNAITQFVNAIAEVRITGVPTLSGPILFLLSAVLGLFAAAGYRRRKR